MSANWNNVPSIVLLEIFKSISSQDRINASSTCKEWRKGLFFSDFWRTLTIFFSTETNHFNKAQFIVQSFINVVRNVSFVLTDDVKFSQIAETFEQLKTNCLVEQIQVFGHRETHLNNDDVKLIVDNFIKCMENMKCLKLVHIEPCWLLGGDCKALINVLNRHSSNISHLGIGYSEKLQLFNSNECNMNSVEFSSFKNLKVLKLHASWVSDEVIHALAANNPTLKRLVIEIGKIIPENKVENETWQYFKQMLPDCELRINLLYTADGIQYLNQFMPITHVKILFCSVDSCSMLKQLTRFTELQSIWFIVEEDTQNGLLLNEDPFVFCAWKCSKLAELVLMGAKLDNDNLVGIARLRGPTLKSLLVCTNDIIKCVPRNYDNKLWTRKLLNTESKILNSKVSKALKRPWSPINESPYQPNDQMKYLNQVLSCDYKEDFI